MGLFRKNRKQVITEKIEKIDGYLYPDDIKDKRCETCTHWEEYFKGWLKYAGDSVSQDNRVGLCGGMTWRSPYDYCGDKIDCYIPKGYVLTVNGFRKEAENGK